MAWTGAADGLRDESDDQSEPSKNFCKPSIRSVVLMSTGFVKPWLGKGKVNAFIDAAEWSDDRSTDESMAMD